MQATDMVHQTGNNHSPPSRLDVLPLAVLSALIVPGALTIDPSNIWIGFSATAVALALAGTRRVPLAWWRRDRATAPGEATPITQQRDSYDHDE